MVHSTAFKKILTPELFPCLCDVTDVRDDVFCACLYDIMGRHAQSQNLTSQANCAEAKLKKLNVSEHLVNTRSSRFPTATQTPFVFVSLHIRSDHNCLETETFSRDAMGLFVVRMRTAGSENQPADDLCTCFCLVLSQPPYPPPPPPPPPRPPLCLRRPKTTFRVRPLQSDEIGQALQGFRLQTDAGPVNLSHTFGPT